MKKCLFISVLFLFGICYGQGYRLANEQIIFSFDTKSGKHLVLAKDTADSYIIYRFGSPKKVEFEFPGKTEESWSKFKYSFYLRGGGAQNEGLDLNYIYFTNNGFKYIIYDTYIAANKESSVGIKVINLKTNKTVQLAGNYRSRTGSLIDFRDNKLLEIIEDVEN